MHRMQSGGWPYSKVGRDSDPRKHRLFMQLFFVQLSFVRRSYVAIVIIDRHVLSISVRARKCVRARAHTEVLEVPEVLIASKAQCKQCETNSVCLGFVCINVLGQI